MNFEGMTPQQKVEYIGYIEANRMYLQEWEGHISFYESADDLVSVRLENESDESDEIKLEEQDY